MSSGGVEGDHVRRRRALGLLLPFVMAGLSLVGLAFLGVFPVRAYLDQRRAVGAAEERAAVLREQNGKLAAQAEALRSDEGVEEIARERYGLVLPGEEAFIVTFDGSTAPGDGRSGGGGAEGGARGDPREEPWPARLWKAMIALL